MKKKNKGFIVSVSAVAVGFVLLIGVVVYQSKKGDDVPTTGEEINVVDEGVTVTPVQPTSEVVGNENDENGETENGTVDNISESENAHKFDNMTEEEVDEYLTERIVAEYGQDYIDSLSGEQLEDLKESQKQIETGGMAGSYADTTIEDSILTMDKENKTQMPKAEAEALKKTILDYVSMNEFQNAYDLILAKSNKYLFTSTTNSFISHMFDDLCLLLNINSSTSEERLVTIAESLTSPEIASIVLCHFPTEVLVQVAAGNHSIVPILNEYEPIYLQSSNVNVTDEMVTKIQNDIAADIDINIVAYQLSSENFNLTAYFYTIGEGSLYHFYGYEESADSTNGSQKVGYWKEIYAAYDEGRPADLETLESYMN